MHFPKIPVNKCIFHQTIEIICLIFDLSKYFAFVSGPFLRKTRFMRVIGVCFTSKCSNAIFLGNSGSHAILKVLLACMTV